MVIAFEKIVWMWLSCADQEEWEGVLHPPHLPPPPPPHLPPPPPPPTPLPHLPPPLRNIQNYIHTVKLLEIHMQAVDTPLPTGQENAPPPSPDKLF